MPRSTCLGTHGALGLTALGLLGGLGCTGDISDPPKGGGPGLGTDEAALCEQEGPMPGPMPRLVRLTHAQYDATIRDLFGVDLEPSAAFLEDPTFAGFSNNAEGLLVPDRLARDYRRAAEEIAGAVMADPAAVDALLSCDVSSGDEACAREMVETLGRRVYRRPMPTEVVDAYLALYAKAGTNAYETGGAFEQGVRLAIEGMLQSPHFLYRVELSEELDGDGIIPLDDWEIAARLSYLMWNSTPDDELLAAAEAGELSTPEGIEKHARRLLADPRAQGPVDDFHEQWLHMKKYDDLAKDPGQYPGWDPALAADMKEETRRFIRRVVLETEGDFAELLTSSTSFVNAELATIYGLEGSYGDELVEAELDPSQRAGFLTHVGFLASHAYPDKSSPIHRGVFIQRQVLCATLPDPPGNVDTTLPPFDGEIKTTRDAVEVHTSPAACAACHDLINAAGFAFESFDAIGAWRTMENGVTVDTAATVKMGPSDVQVDGAVDVAHQLAQSPVASKCYLTQWFRYGYGRQETKRDLCTIDALDELMTENGYDIQELLVALTQTKTFRFRAVEEVGQ